MDIITDELFSKSGTIGVQVSKDLDTGVYTLISRRYFKGNLISEQYTDFDPHNYVPIDHLPEDTKGFGSIQMVYPDLYDKITSIKELTGGLKLSFYGEQEYRAANGLGMLCANCTKLQHVNIKEDFDFVIYEREWSETDSQRFTLWDHRHVFYNCTSLQSVDFGDIFVYKDANDNLRSRGHLGDCAYMFAGCSNLTNIYPEYIYLNSDSFTHSEHMFDGCVKLSGLKFIKPYYNLLEPFTHSLTGITYEHAYEYLGLTENQFTQVDVDDIFFYHEE